jgi:sirohydrochlorin ferrochelatase
VATHLKLKPHQGILVVAHGSVLPGAERDVLRLAEGLRELTGARVVEVGFLDYTEPLIPRAVASCVENGVEELFVLPFFFTGGYLLNKCVRQVEQAAANYPHLKLNLAKPLGPHPKLADAVLKQASEMENG